MAMKRLKLDVRSSSVAPEYTSIADAFSRGEALRNRGEVDLADAYFRLGLSKAQLLEQTVSSGRLRATALHRTVISRKGVTAAQDNARVPAVPSTAARKLPPLLPLSPSPSPTVTITPEPEVPPATVVETPVPESNRLSGRLSLYTVRKGDSLRTVGARFGVSSTYLARKNGLRPDANLRTGQKIRVSNRRIIPKIITNGIVINIPDRTLYYFRKGALVTTAPVATGKPKKQGSRGWETPIGPFTIEGKIANPVWHVPASIRKEMVAQGKEVITDLPAGPDNPLGSYAFRTSIPRILIHGTNAPASIYGTGSHGCIRVLPSRMEELFRIVSINTRGEIIYKPVKALVTENGRVLLEVHRDSYGRIRDMEREVRDILQKLQAEDAVDWVKVEAVLKDKAGIAEDVTL